MKSFDSHHRPVIIEVPHFAALRGKEREIVILRSDNGETWREHTLEATEDAVQEVLQESFDADGNLVLLHFNVLCTLLKDLNTIDSLLFNIFNYIYRNESVGRLKHEQNYTYSNN